MQETKSPDGTTMINFPDGSRKVVSAGGQERISFLDGTLVTVEPGGQRTVKLPNGQVEEHTPEYKV